MEAAAASYTNSINLSPLSLYADLEKIAAAPMLRCDLVHTDLDDEPNYKAISYACQT